MNGGVTAIWPVERGKPAAPILAVIAPPGVWAARLAEFGLIAAMAAATHAIVLRLIFPGFYDPLWPNHSDYYLPSELAHTPGAFVAVFGRPRPFGYLFFYLTGFLGTRGAMACNLALVFVNCALTAMAVRRIAGIGASPGFFAAVFVYLFLIFAQPMQYTWATYDAFSQLSYLFGLTGLVLAWKGAPLWAQFVLFCIAFLAKETYVLSALIIAVAWWLGAPGPRRKAAVSTTCALLGGLLAALAQGKLAGSEYLGAGATALSPYHVDLSVLSIAKSWGGFAKEYGLALWVYVVLLVLAAGLCRRRLTDRVAVMALVLPGAGLLAWLPNALLPNHLIAGYSWNGAYLVFAPLILFAGLWAAKGKALLAGLMILGLLTPIGLKGAYAVNVWANAQQARQRLLMSAVQARLKTLSPRTRTVLVTGLDFPFNPFDHPRSLYEYARRLPAFNVVAYQPRGPSRIERPSPVQWSTAQQAAGQSFDDIWMFDEAGRAIDWKLSSADAQTLRALGVNPAGLAIYPAVAAAFGLGDPKSAGALNFDGYHLLNCGAAYIGYRQFALAQACLNASRVRLPDNPYPYYFSGLVAENGGRRAQARADFAGAVARDDKTNPNPAFTDALKRIDSSASHPPG